MWGGFFSRYVRLGEESDIIPQDSSFAPVFVVVQDAEEESSLLRKWILAVYFFSSAVDAPDAYLCEHSICYLMNRYHANTLSVAFTPPEKSYIVKKDWV
jgi:hypothetical protein